MYICIAKPQPNPLHAFPCCHVHYMHPCTTNPSPDPTTSLTTPASTDSTTHQQARGPGRASGAGTRTPVQSACPTPPGTYPSAPGLWRTLWCWPPCRAPGRAGGSGAVQSRAEQVKNRGEQKQRPWTQGRYAPGQERVLEDGVGGCVVRGCHH